MTRLWIGVIAFAAGVVIGLEAAKFYAQSTIKGDLDTGLAKLGLGGGTVQSSLDGLVPVLVS